MTNPGEHFVHGVNLGLNHGVPISVKVHQHLKELVLVLAPAPCELEKRVT